VYSWDERVQIIKVWIDENLENIPSLSELAKHIGYSYFYVTRKFHEIEGVSFRKYIVNRKIQQAAIDLYMTSERTIDIAIRYGYSSQEAFTRAFVKIYGISPADYRRIQKPNLSAEKIRLLNSVGFTKPIGGTDMKIYVKQMYDWNYYAYFAENVDERYWDYFKSDLWWQIGNSFTKSFDNVKDFEYCAENFTKYGETAIKQQLKIIPIPWEKALDVFITEISKLDVDWFIHGSVAMTLWGIDVAPKDINIIIANCFDFDKVRNHFNKYAIRPIERCNDWIMSGLGYIFMETTIGIAIQNKDIEPYDMSQLEKVDYNGHKIFIVNLDTLKQNNDYYGRPERVKLIEEKMKQTI